MDELVVKAVAEALHCETYLARAMIKSLKAEGYRIVRAKECPWRRAQIRSDHGELSDYGRRCDLTLGHEGLHRPPKAAKQ